MKKGIIFDMDGTLWNSAANVATSWTIALKEAGYAEKIVTEDDMYRTMGRTMDVIADMLFPFVEGEEREELLQACCIVENVYLAEHGGILYPGLVSTMEALKNSGYHLYIVSNCNAGYIEAFLEYYKFEDLFEDIECFGNNGKSKGENIKLLYDRNDLDAACYVGDIQGDFDATKEAGLPFIHAAYGFGSVKEPDGVISCLADLAEVVPNVI